VSVKDSPRDTTTEGAAEPVFEQAPTLSTPLAAVVAVPAVCVGTPEYGVGNVVDGPACQEPVASNRRHGLQGGL